MPPKHKWSEWTWSHEHGRYYRYRLSKTDPAKYEYEWASNAATVSGAVDTLAEELQDLSHEDHEDRGDQRVPEDRRAAPTFATQEGSRTDHPHQSGYSDDSERAPSPSLPTELPPDHEGDESILESRDPLHTHHQGDIGRDEKVRSRPSASRDKDRERPRDKDPKGRHKDRERGKTKDKKEKDRSPDKNRERGKDAEGSPALYFAAEPDPHYSERYLYSAQQSQPPEEHPLPQQDTSRYVRRPSSNTEGQYGTAETGVCPPFIPEPDAIEDASAEGAEVGQNVLG